MKAFLSKPLVGERGYFWERVSFEPFRFGSQKPLLDEEAYSAIAQRNCDEIASNCGQQEKATIPMDQVTSTNFNLKQRESFARMLIQAKAEVQAELGRTDYAVPDEVRTEMLPKLAKEHGATELITNVRRLQAECAEAETALSKLGFSCDDDGISLTYRGPKSLKEAVESAEHAARQERKKVLKQYDLGILGIWASEDAQEAKKIVEGLL